MNKSSGQVGRAGKAKRAGKTVKGHPAAQQEALQAAARAAARLTISDVRYISFTARAFYRLDQVPDDARIKPRVGFTRPKIESVGQEIKIRLSLVFSVLADSEGAGWVDEPVVTIRACTEATYRPNQSAEAPEDSDVRHFASIQTPFHVWGYWREFVQSSLARLQLPALTIPFYRVTDAARLVLDEDPD